MLLFLGLILVSTAGPFLHLAAMDAFAVAFWRLAGTAVVFLLWGLATNQLGFAQADLSRIAFGGVLLGTHFALWIWAFDLTDFASNLLLLVTEPITAALVGARFGERTQRAMWLSVALAFLGLAVIAGGDISLGPRALLGDFICIIGSVAITFFYALTQKQRRTTPLAGFMAISMGAGALAVLPVVLLTHSRLFSYPRTSWSWLGGLILITTVAGHGVFNYVSRQVKLFTLNVVVVLEPAVGVAMGWGLFGASMTRLQLLGGAILAVAVVIGLLPEWRDGPQTAAVGEIEGIQ
jgi:drug/metabolite transporter (DMT)-like permease